MDSIFFQNFFLIPELFIYFVPKFNFFNGTGDDLKKIYHILYIPANHPSDGDEHPDAGSKLYDI